MTGKPFPDNGIDDMSESFTRADLMTALKDAQQRALAEYPHPTEGGTAASVIADMDRQAAELYYLRAWLLHGEPIKVSVGASPIPSAPLIAAGVAADEPATGSPRPGGGQSEAAS